MTRREARREAQKQHSLTGRTHYVCGSPAGLYVVDDEGLKVNELGEHIIHVTKDERPRAARETNPHRKVMRLSDAPEILADLRDHHAGRKGARYDAS